MDGLEKLMNSRFSERPHFKEKGEETLRKTLDMMVYELHVCTDTNINTHMREKGGRL